MFNLEQEVVNKTLEIVQNEIKTKNQLRNYSAMKMPTKQKMEMFMLNSENGITQREKAKMSSKLLTNYGRNRKLRANLIE